MIGHDASTGNIIQAVNLICGGQVTELRALDATVGSDRWPTTYSGYFDDAEKLAEAVATIKTAKGIYIIPNPVQPALLARKANRIAKAGKGDLTTDADIESRRWLLIDTDAVRPARISSTDAEHQAAMARAREIRVYLASLHWPQPIHADSGNGGHLLYRIDLPAVDGGIVERCLKSLAQRFNDEAVTIDIKVHNPARVWKLYGTLACKGDDTPDRPHRLAHIIHIPDDLHVAPAALLETLAAEYEPEMQSETQANGGHHHNGNGQAFDLEEFIRRNSLNVDDPQPWKGAGRLWVFRESPLCDHHDGAAYVAQQPSGALIAGCHHNSCSWGWRELRERIDPRNQLNGQSPRKSTEPAEHPLPRPPFPVETLPEAVAGYVTAASSAIGCDPAYVALPVLTCLARAVGNKRTIRLKRTWEEPAILWGCIVGKSGTHKTPALKAATTIIQRKQAETVEKYQQALVQYQTDEAKHRKSFAQWLRDKKDNEPPPWKPEEPVCERYVTTDVTIEALVDRLSTQCDGIVVVRDELAGWLGGIAEYKGGKGSDLGHWLACWSGEPITVDRKTGPKKFSHVPRASVSIVGGIQPGVLRQAIGREHLQDGLCARLLLTMPPPRPVRWSEATVHPEAEAALGEVFDRLLALDPAADPEGKPAAVAVPLSGDAKTVWVDYYNMHRTELAELDDDLAAAWSKLEAYTARFALLFALCRGGEQIDRVSMEAAITLSNWFGIEARRVYSIFGEDDEERERRQLVELIQRRGGRITVRDLQHACRQYRGDSADAEAALNGLADAGLGAWEVVPTGRRPRREFALSTAVTVTEFNNRPDSRNNVTVTSGDEPENELEEWEV